MSSHPNFYLSLYLLIFREDIIKLQDFAIGKNEDDEMNINVVEDANILRDKMLGLNQNVQQLKIDIEEFLKHQDESYRHLLKNMKEEEDRRKREEEEEEEKRRKLARNLHLLELEAEENRLRQKQEILQMLDGDMLELNKMKDQVLLLVGKQKKIKKIRRKRRQLPTILEEDGEGDDADIDDLMDRTNNLLGNINDNENKILAIKNEVDGNDPEDLMTNVRSLEDDIIKQSKTVDELTRTTNRLYDEEEKLLQQQNQKNENMKDTKEKALQRGVDMATKYGQLIADTEKIIEKQNDVDEIYKHLDNVDQKDMTELQQLQANTRQYKQSLEDIQSSVELLGFGLNVFLWV